MVMVNGLMIDRSASPFAGLRSASVRQTTDKENNRRSHPLRSPQTILFPRRAAASFNQITGANSRYAIQFDHD